MMVSPLAEPYGVNTSFD